VLAEEEVVFADELDELADTRGFRLVHVVGDHATDEGRDLLSPAHLRELVPDIDDRDIFLCGPPAMTSVVEDNLRRAHVPRRHIHVERFAL
jgi:ferredoxin-NADP reductase